MKRRWIIRGIFIALLTLSVGGWVTSARYSCNAQFWHGNCGIGAGATQGAVGFYFIQQDGSIAVKRLHYTCHRRPDIRFWPKYSLAGPTHPSGEESFYSLLGFAGGHRVHQPLESWSFSLPYWFLTLLSAAALWFAWLRTRPDLDPRTAFPIEVNPC